MIAVRAGADTHHVVNADILKRLGEDGCVVNIARGSVIDQAALVKALTDKTIAGAGLDVLREGAARPRRVDRVAECRADPAYRRPYARIAHRDAGLRDRQPRGVFCRETAGLSGERGLKGRFSVPNSPKIWFAANCREICPWQGGKDSLKSPFRTCWRSLARLCSHSDNPNDRRPFLSGHPLGLLERKGKAVVCEEIGQGRSGLPDASILSETAGAREKLKFLQRLNRMACIDG